MTNTAQDTKPPPEAEKLPPQHDEAPQAPPQAPAPSLCARVRKHRDHIVMLVLCFWINVQSAASISCLGVLLVEFMEFFKVSRAAVTWVAGAHMGVSVIVGPVCGIMLKQFGARVVGIVFALISASGLVLAAFINNLGSLYVTFGLMAGAGPCTYYAIANSTIQHYFQRHRSLACAIVLTAFSIGGFAWPPFCRWLIKLYNWQGALLIIAGLHIQLLVPFTLMGVLEKSSRHKQRLMKIHAKDNSTEDFQKLNGNNQQRLQNETKSNGHVTENSEVHIVGRRQEKSVGRCFLSWLCLTCMYSIGVCFGMILHAGVMVYTPVRSKELGLSKDQGALLVSVISAAGGFCRIPAGLLGDVRRVNRGFLLASAIAICGVLAFVSQFVQSFALLAAFSAVYGCIIAVYLALQAVVLSDIAGFQHLPIAMGILLAGHGSSSLILHPIAGLLIDLTGSANTVFITVGLVGIGGGVLVTIVTALKIYSKRNKKEERGKNQRAEEETVPLQTVPWTQTEGATNS